MKQLFTICTLIWFGVSRVQASQLHTGEEQDESSDVQQYEEHTTRGRLSINGKDKVEKMRNSVLKNHNIVIDLGVAASNTRSLKDQLVTALLKIPFLKRSSIDQGTLKISVTSAALRNAAFVEQVLDTNNLKSDDILQTKGTLADTLLSQVSKLNIKVLRLSFNTKDYEDKQTVPLDQYLNYEGV